MPKKCHKLFEWPVKVMYCDFLAKRNWRKSKLMAKLTPVLQTFYKQLFANVLKIY